MDKNTTTTFTTAIADIQGGIETKAAADSTSTGSNQNVTLLAPITTYTNASLTSIQNITLSNRADASLITIRNKTTGNLTLKNLTGGTAANQINTGIGNDLILPDGAGCSMYYDTVNSKWQVVSMAGSDVNAANIAAGVLGSTHLPTPITINDGTLAAPAYSFRNETGSGWYRAGTNDLILSNGGVLAVEINKYSSTQMNFGFGTAASAGANNPLSAGYTVNGPAYFNYSNLSGGSSSSTVFYIGAGPLGANGITIENTAYNSTAYNGGGGILSAGSNLTQLIVASEYSTGFIGFAVGGRASGNEVARINTGDVTFAKGIPLKLSGSTSGVFTQQAANSTTSYTVKWPSAQGGSNTTLKNDGSGNMSWTSLSSAPLNVVSKTTTYSIQTGDDLVLCDASSGSFTLTLFANSGNTGATVRVKKTSFDPTKTCTVKGNGAENIDNSNTYVLASQFEEVMLTSDGSQWRVIAHHFPSVWVSYTPTFTGFGTVSSVNMVSRRVGDSLEVQGTFVAGTVTAVTGKMTLGFGGTDQNVTIDNTAGKVGAARQVGTWTASFNGGTGFLIATANNNYVNFSAVSGSQAGLTIISNLTTTFPNSATVSVHFMVPIDGWQG